MSAERRLYELINPSDAITFLATAEEATVLAAILGASWLFVKDAETGEVPNAGNPDELRDAIWSDAARIASYADAFRSFLCCSPKDRRLFEDAASRMSPDDAAAFRAKWQEEKRTSLNDICSSLWEAGEKIALEKPRAA